MRDRSDEPLYHERTLYHGATSRSSIESNLFYDIIIAVIFSFLFNNTVNTFENNWIHFLFRVCEEGMGVRYGRRDCCNNIDTRSGVGARGGGGGGCHLLDPDTIVANRNGSCNKLQCSHCES